MDLHSQRVVILGGTSGIGLATAKAAARSGTEVTVISRRPASVDRALAQLPPSARGPAVDLTDPALVCPLLVTRPRGARAPSSRLDLTVQYNRHILDRMVHIEARLANKTALVTGATSNIGRAIAAAFAPASVRGDARAGPRARVVIVGAGFGGLECARKLDRAAVDVLLLDRGGYHLFTPLLYQVATALLNPSEIAYPLRSLFRKSPNVRVSATAVTGIDLRRCVVRASPGEEIPYDYLVLATGSTSNYHGNEQLAENSIGLKTLEDGTHLRNHVLGCLERADSETDPGERRALLTFVVAGGGPGGVEYSGALSELLRLVAGRDFPAVRLEDTHVLLVQNANRLLTAFSQRLGRYAERTLTSRGVEVRTKTHITAADGHQVTLSDGSVVSARTVVWTGGVAPLVPSTQPEPGKDRSRRVRVDEFLRIPGAQRAYALGDAAAAGPDGQELPMVSAPAIQAGRYVARAIRSDLSGDEAGPPFTYFDKGRMATIGRNAAVAQLRGGLELTGFAGWLAWLLVHVWYLAGLRNRVMTLASWAWYYLRLDRPIRIILQTPPDPIVSSLRTPNCKTGFRGEHPGEIELGGRGVG